MYEKNIFVDMGGSWFEKIVSLSYLGGEKGQTRRQQAFAKRKQ